MDHYDPKNEDQHFFATCAFGWVTDASLATVIERIKRFKQRSPGKGKKSPPLYIGVYHVPLEPKAPYQINYFVPQVEGITKVWEGEV